MEITTTLVKRYIIRDLSTGLWYNSTYWGSDCFTEHAEQAYFYEDKIKAINSIRDLSWFFPYEVIEVYRNMSNIKEA